MKASIFSGIRRVAVAVAALAIPAVVSAADWPQFMGPTRNAVSAEKGLIRAFPEGGPKVLWTTQVGKGFGGASIRAGKVYVLDRVDQKQDIVRCMDLASGKEDWRFAYDAPGGISFDGSRSVPAVTDKHVYTVGAFGQLHCIDLKTHEVVWKQNVLTDYGTRRRKPMWAISQSPLLYKDMVIVAPQTGEAGIVALDQATGKEIWRSPGVGELAYASPMPLTIDGVEQILIVTVEGAAAVSAADGKLLWKFAHPCKIPVPNVTDLGGGKFFISEGYRAGSAIFQVSREGSTWSAKSLVKVADIGGHVHPGLLHQGHIYILCNTNEREDGLVCFDTEGKLVWQTKREPNLCKGGSILTADGLIYQVDGRQGELHIIEPSSAGFKSLAKAKVLSGKEQMWGPLALSDGRLIIRDQDEMKCLDLRQ